MKDIIIYIDPNLSFPIRLGMVNIDVSQLSVKTRKQAIPKISSENWISDAYNNVGVSV
jgi:hypothetical protein